MVQDYFPALITAIATLGAAFIAFVLNEYKNQKNRNEQIKLVRTLLSIEIAQNLKILSELWNNINLEAKSIKVHPFEGWILDMSQDDERKVILAGKLINSNLPIWKDESWKSQHYFLPIALNENEIRIISDFYNDLYAINFIYSSLLVLKEKDDKAYRIHQIKLKKQVDELIPFLHNFYLHAPSFWDKFEKICLKLIENRNPLT